MQPVVILQLQFILPNGIKRKLLKTFVASKTSYYHFLLCSKRTVLKYKIVVVQNNENCSTSSSSCHPVITST